LIGIVGGASIQRPEVNLLDSLKTNLCRERKRESERESERERKIIASKDNYLRLSVFPGE
jgi:hypothetical protein